MTDDGNLSTGGSTPVNRLNRCGPAPRFPPSPLLPPLPASSTVCSPGFQGLPSPLSCMVWLSHHLPLPHLYLIVTELLEQGSWNALGPNPSGASFRGRTTQVWLLGLKLPPWNKGCAGHSRQAAHPPEWPS